jgi:hypothetical protein
MSSDEMEEDLNPAADEHESARTALLKAMESDEESQPNKLTLISHLIKPFPKCSQIQQEQLTANCKVDIEPLDLSAFEKVGPFYRVKKPKRRNLAKSSANLDSDDESGIDKLLSTAYLTRSRTKHLKSRSEDDSDSSSSFYENEKDAAKRAIVKAFNPTEEESYDDNDLTICAPQFNESMNTNSMTKKSLTNI